MEDVILKYYIYQGLGNSGELSKAAEVTDVKTYTVTELEANTVYRFAVSAYNGVRESAKSNIVTAVTAKTPVQYIVLATDWSPAPEDTQYIVDNTQMSKLQDGSFAVFNGYRTIYFNQ